MSRIMADPNPDEPISDAELASWEGTAPIGRVSIGGLDLRRIIFRLRQAEKRLAANDPAPKAFDLAEICRGEVHVYAMYQTKCWCGKETRPPLWSDPD
jgi:hypothetical protein